jgi:hypothetical protein
LQSILNKLLYVFIVPANMSHSGFGPVIFLRALKNKKFAYVCSYFVLVSRIFELWRISPYSVKLINVIF